MSICHWLLEFLLSYIADQDLRLRLYRRIADLRDETEIGGSHP